MKTTRGFTIVEIVIVVAVMAILVGMGFMVYSQVQRDTRDGTRKGNVLTITEALEDYYVKKGEYPSVQSIVNNNVANTGAVVAAKLSITTNDLKMPLMPSSATNAITSTPGTPSNDYIGYVAVSAINNTNCQTVVAAGCDGFTLRYLTEAGVTVVVESRNK
jgi:prepilin-type N-terminal cleavage/methylation domain-containing protein